MKSPCILRYFLVLLSAVMFGGIVNSAYAQPAKTNASELRLITIHHVRSDIMASWLDPTHHHSPAKYTEQLAANPSAVPTFHAAPEPALESGKATIISIVNQHNALLIYSDQTLFDRLKQEVDVLDKPIPGIDSASDFPKQDISTGNDISANADKASKQDVKPGIDANSSDKQWHEIPIKNVRSGLLAYWIDPSHQAKPVEYQTAANYLRQAVNPKQNDIQRNADVASKHDVNPEIETNSPDQRWYQMSIKNVRPDILAWWIDPAHQAKPVEYVRADDYFRQTLTPQQLENSAKSTDSPYGKSASKSVLGSPFGVTKIFADDANNAIWVRATPDGFAQLKGIVNFLDRPIRKIDFDIKLIQLNSVDVALLQSDPRLKQLFEPEAPYGNLIADQSLISTFAEVIKTGDAKVIKSSQLVFQNNLTDRYTTSTFTPVTVDIKQADNGDPILTTQADKDNPLFMERRLSLVLTPTINNDDTITLFNNVSMHAELTHQQSAATDDLLWVKTLDNQKGMTTVATLKNGSAMLFTGYNSTMLGIDNQHHPIVISVQAQIKK